MATLTLTLTPELEQRLHEVATQQGLNPTSYILNLLQQRLSPPPAIIEAELLEQVSIGLSQDTWKRYHTLIAKRQAETLTPAEQTELIEISERIEQANVHRIQVLIALSERQGTSL